MSVSVSGEGVRERRGGGIWNIKVKKVEKRPLQLLLARYMLAHSDWPAGGRIPLGTR